MTSTDAAVLCRRELDAWLPAYVGSGFFGFRDPGPDRRCASWFLASEPGGPIVTRLDARLRDFFTGVDPRPTGRLRRSLVHRLRPIVESRAAWTRFWFTPISMRSLRVTPYYSLHYLFNHLVARDPACRAQWDATPGFPADDPHLVARLGMTAPATEDVRRQLDTSTSPLLKLSWKHPITVDGQATTIGHALSSQEVRRG